MTNEKDTFLTSLLKSGRVNIPMSFNTTKASNISLSRGLNTQGIMKASNDESSDLRNVDFCKFGSVLKRKGYYHLNATSIAVSGASPYVPGTDNPPPISGDTGDWGIPMIDASYAVSYASGNEEIVNFPEITITHSESK